MTTRNKQPNNRISPARERSVMTRRQLIVRSAAGVSIASAALAGAALLPGGAGPVALSKPTVPEPPPLRPHLRRGGSIHTMMNWADLENGSRDRFAWPPFARDHFDIPAGFLKVLASTGIDFIRMTVDQGPFLQAQGSRKAQLDAILLAKCRQILDAGFNLVVDIHPVNQVERYHPYKIAADINGALFKQYTAMVAHVAKVLKSLETGRVAFEPFNEPPYGYRPKTAARWQKMMLRMHAGIRENNPDIPVIWSGAKSADISSFASVDPAQFRDDNIYWSFHYYTPHHFTHQGVRVGQSNMTFYRYLTDLPYPALGGSEVLTQQVIEQSIMVDNAFPPSKRKTLQLQARKAVREYFESSHGPAMIEKDFDIVSTWAKRHKIPAHRIFLGEFGVVRRSRSGNGPVSSHRHTWLSAVRNAAERRGFGWALWDINQPGMGVVYKRDTAIFDEPMLNALGLKTPKARRSGKT